MIELTIEINSNQEIWDLIDKRWNSIFLHKFSPNPIIEWWKTDLNTQSEITLKNILVRQMQMDVQTDLEGLKTILSLNPNPLRMYQSEKLIPDTLLSDQLPEHNRDIILQQNGIKHKFFMNYEYLHISSFDHDFIHRIASHPVYGKRIIDSDMN